MIHVCVILDKHGKGNDCVPLGSLSICNDGTGTEDSGNYDILQVGRNGQVVKKRRLLDWPRKKKSPMQLIGRCFKELGL